MTSPESLKKQILDLVRSYSRLTHSSFFPCTDNDRSQWPSGAPVPYAGRVFDENEVEAAVSSVLDFWLTLGSEGDKFQGEFAEFLGLKHCLLVNSGSSANLIALSTLTSPKLPANKRIHHGDEVITVAAGFPTTVAPILQIGAVPVFVDADPSTANIVVEHLHNALSPNKTKAVILAHALGNPFNIGAVLKFCQDNNLWLIEDNCDALGSTYSMPVAMANNLGIYNNSPGLDEGPDRIIRWTGTWGHISTQSFYPPHHMTMGEGGSVNINDSRLKSIAESYRDWGRDCWCPSGVDNTCNRRFSWQLGDLPEGYDHKYTYSHFGYNLKPLDVQAAIGRVQLRKLPSFIKSRKDNWTYLRTGLNSLSKHIDFMLPTHATGWSPEQGFAWDSSGCRANPSWFGFMISIKDSSPVNRTEIARELDKNLIGNRMFFGGNLLRQPAFTNLSRESPQSIKTASTMQGADNIMNNSLFLGTYPGLDLNMMNHEINILQDILNRLPHKQD